MDENQYKQLAALMTQGAEAQAQYDQSADDLKRAFQLQATGANAPQMADGYISPLHAIREVIAGSRGRKMEREARPTLEKARQMVAQGRAATQNAGLAQALQKLSMQDRAVGVQEAQVAQMQDNAAFRQSQQKPINLVSVDGVPATGTIDAQGQLYIDGQPVNGSEWLVNPMHRPTGGGGSGQNATDLNRFYKKLEPIQPMLSAADDITKMLQNYGVGGKYQDVENIAGLGGFTSGTGVLGDVSRAVETRSGAVDSAESAKNYSTIRNFVSKILRAEGGTAQTLQETRNILGAMGLTSDNLSALDEEVFLRRWPEIVASLERSVGNIKSTTPDSTRDAYIANTQRDNTANFFEYMPQKVDLSNRVFSPVAPPAQQAPAATGKVKFLGFE